jgi:hypothetical protein
MQYSLVPLMLLIRPGLLRQDNMAKGDVFIQSRKPYIQWRRFHEISYGTDFSEHVSIDQS